MASTAASAVPAAPSVDVTSATDAAPDVNATETVVSTQTGEAKPEPAPARFRVKGQEYTEEELFEALGARNSITEQLKGLSKREQELAERDSAFSSKDRSKAIAALKKAGWTAAELEEMSAEVLEAHIKDAQLTPAERELAQYKAREAEQKAAEQAAKDKAEAEAKAKETEALVEKFVAQYQESFMQAMVDEGLPRTAQALSAIVDLVLEANDAGYEVTPAEAAKIYRSRHVEPQRSLFEGMDATQLRAALGDKVVDTIIKAHTESLRASVAKAPDAPAKRVTGGKPVPRRASGEGSLEDTISGLLSGNKRR